MIETKTKHPDVIYREGKPAAVILNIDDYEELLEQIEDTEDIAYLQELRRNRMEFISLEDLLKE
ncbi:MAG: type II toxin-antitoxin system Phd/YefM family antitoxin [Candidatus Hatepunaea meridiana]|nr:type II toxin-antitoxin system Phd/YefM family antitoxin [Candidatus Hatepunaea meridiana]